VPLLALLVPALVITTFVVWTSYDLDPIAVVPLFMASQITVLLAALTIAVWFLFFSGFRWVTKLVVVLLVASLPFVARIWIRKLEFTGTMGAIVIWHSDPDPTKELDRRLAEQPAPGDDLPAIDLTVGWADYAEYRGPHRDGVAAPLRLETDWKAHPPRLQWKQSCGGGYAGFAVAGNVAVTIEQRHDKEAVVCYDRATGRERYAYSYDAVFRQSEPMGGDGPRATPTIHDGAIYSLGAMGDLVCLEGATGKLRWHANILKDSGAKNVDWGMTGSPLVLGSVVIVNPGIDPKKAGTESKGGQAVAAYDCQSGKRVWAKGEHAAGYSSPQRATLAGVEQVLLFDAGGLAGIDPKDGTELWRFAWPSFSDMNIIQPLVLEDDRVFIASTPSNGCALVQVRKADRGWSAEEVWRNRELSCKFSNPVAYQGSIYGLGGGRLTCLDPETGKRRWREGRFGDGQVVLVGKVLLVSSELGPLVAVAAEPAGYRELGRFDLFAGKTWNTPAVAFGQLFIRNHAEMACLDLPEPAR
jgi:outer membrane protein assembly factor BamB